MKNLFILLLLFSLSLAGRANMVSLFQADRLPKKSRLISPKEKTYCSGSAKTKYRVLITGTKIKITRLYKEYIDSYTGVIKNGKIYSNDPEEKKLKDLHGKYYKLQGKNFGVLNIENGDYEWFTECKH
jgi:hypothetical protein